MLDINTLLPVSHVIMPLTGETRNEIFTNLAAPLINDGIIEKPKVFIDDLERRESQLTTQVENGVALPHARSRTVKRLGLVIGLAPAPGLCFNLETKGLSKVFFLIAIPAFAPTAHLPLLQKLANFAKDEARREKLFAAADAKQVVKMLNTYKN